MDYTLSSEILKATKDLSGWPLIAGTLILMLFASTFIITPLKRDDRARNKHAIVCFILVLVVIFIVGYFRLSNWWLLLCLLPPLYLPLRWCYFKNLVKEYHNVKKSEADIKGVELLHRLQPQERKYMNFEQFFFVIFK